MQHSVRHGATQGELPINHSWFAGRRWAGAVYAVLSVAWIGLLISRLLGGPLDTTGQMVAAATEAVLTVGWAVLAVVELTSRITVDAQGVHQSNVFRRRSIRWDQIAAIHRPTPERPRVVLVRHEGKDLSLANSAGELHMLKQGRYRPA